MPPAVPGAADATTFGYDLDKAVTRISQPGGRQIDLAYDAAGRVATVTFPTGVITTGYDATTGHVTSISGPTGVDLGYSYDGARLTGTTFSGAVNHAIAWSHDGSFRLTSETIDGGNAVAYAYDNDDLVTQAGALQLARAPTSGRVTGTTAGSVTDALTYSPYGEIASYSAAANGAPLIAYSYVRDDLGRIAEKTETRGGVSHVFAYAYDDAGRLTSVSEDGVIVEAYEWDENGNRVAGFNGDGAFTATYDNQDRIETSSRWIFEHEPSGEVKRKTDVDTLDTTLYEHDALGNLRSVDLPDGRHVEYLVDAQGRRVQKKVDGVAQKGWIWRSGLQPVAELDGTGNVVARYTYAGGGNAPALIEKGGATYRVVKDHLGSVRLVVDVATGSVVQELEYDSWGRVLVDTNPGWQPFGYAGGLYDADTGLVRFGAREYDAETGRWLTKDAHRFSDTHNLYEYASSHPVDSRDPTGFDTCTFECRGGYDHTWVQFGGDPERSYGFWPDESNGPSSVFDPFHPGDLRTDDSPMADCDPAEPVCRASTPEEEATVEGELVSKLSKQPYFFGISDCRQVPEYVDRRLDELQAKSNFWRDVEDAFWFFW